MSDDMIASCNCFENVNGVLSLSMQSQSRSGATPNLTQIAVDMLDYGQAPEHCCTLAGQCRGACIYKEGWSCGDTAQTITETAYAHDEMKMVISRTPMYWRADILCKARYV